MKKIILALGLLALAPALLAANCLSDLRNRNGILISTFEGYGRTSYEACQDSRAQCDDELYWLLRSGNYPGAYCEERYNNPYPNPDPRYYQCRANMVRNTGGVMARFDGSSNRSEQEACTNALRSCNSDLNRRGIRGAYCEIERRGVPNPRPGNPTPRPVTYTCSVELTGPYGQVRDIISVSATANNYNQARQTACERALKRCQALSSRSDSCRVR